MSDADNIFGGSKMKTHEVVNKLAHQAAYWFIAAVGAVLALSILLLCCTS